MTYHRFCGSGENRAEGAWYRDRELGEHVAYLDGLHDMAQTAGSYHSLLSGESALSDPPENQGSINDKRILNELGLSEALDTALTQGKTLTPKIFTEAAAAAGVNPLQPYLLAQK